MLAALSTEGAVNIHQPTNASCHAHQVVMIEAPVTTPSPHVCSNGGHVERGFFF